MSPDRLTPATEARPAKRRRPSSRRGRPGYDRDTLLRVCVEVFNRHGYEATSMGLLAEELGISKSAIYHHVKSKEEILDVALSHSLSELERVVAEAEALEVPAAMELETILRESVNVLTRSLPYVTLLLRLRGNSELETAALHRRREITRRIAALIGEAQEDGDLREDINARTASRLVMGMINSIVDWYRPERAESAAPVTDAVVDLVLAGLRRPTD